METFKSLSELGVAPNVVSQYQILCLPENIENQTETTPLADSGESITLSKLLKEKGVKCANSYDLGLNTKTSERRGADLWLGSIWILDHAALPLFIGVVGRLLGEKIQKKLDAANQLKASQESDDSQETKVHADIKVIDGKLSAEIKYNGDADTFLKVIKGLYDEQQSP
ncbi:hypothetical protein QUA54_09350 [Microcoleus sp. MOSTC5]|uniref:hypothetical protein n=1 Tax=Microcoleus sp. MOSTC5 TaxID=3055378 RepID=UPI002FD1C0CC